MCGIAGYLGKEKFSGNVLAEMSNQISHRGPDANGYWSNEDQGVYFCHLRLSILDVSSAGAQPMSSRSGRYMVVFNGEIYNFPDLRAELEKEGGGYPWRGHSDTEMFLAGFEHWGIDATIRKLTGMFAMAVWDLEQQELYLVRDRLGEKPLYYGWQGGSFLFGSELKAFTKHPEFKKEINIDAVAAFFKYNYIPGPLSIYKNIAKLKPGSYCKVSLQERKINHVTYWNLDAAIEAGETARLSSSADPATSILHLEELLKSAVKKQMLSDVPLGAFLSGGVDSSAIVALMQAQSSSPVKTFSIGFDEERFNEAEYAKAVAKHLGTHHTELYVRSQNALDVIPSLPRIYDEPFSDSSQIPTYLVAKLARQHVTVSLSGDAGDELFSGYNRYLLAQNVWSKISFLPVSVRKQIGSYISGKDPEALNRFYNKIKFLIPSRYALQNFGDKMHKASALLDKATKFDLYDGLLSHWDPEQLVPASRGNSRYAFSDNGSLNFIEQMMRLDTLTYLPDDILAKVDRAAMANSLETRVPFLDHKVVEFAWQLPLDLKLRNGKSKWILREVLYKYVPKEVIERPKMGFGVPLDAWLRGPLREWAENLLSKKALNKHGFLNYDLIKQKWDEHQSGRKNWQYHLWDVLMFQAWYEEYQS